MIKKKQLVLRIQNPWRQEPQELRDECKRAFWESEVKV